MQNVTFGERLYTGQIGEGRIAGWLRKRGFSVLPVYDVEINTGKGPRLFAPDKVIIAPDMLAIKTIDNTLWVEAKHKTAFTWHRITQRWVTGIDIRHYLDYCKIEDTSPFRVWLMFLHEGGQAKDSPPNSPSGLFGNSLAYLRLHENHRSEKWGSHGMVYWDVASLKKLAELNEC